MKELEITKEKMEVEYDNNYTHQWYKVGYIKVPFPYNDDVPEHKNNAELIADAFNTANKCGYLPSELLKQRDELLQGLDEANYMLINASKSISGPQYGLLSLIAENKRLINKITDAVEENIKDIIHRAELQVLENVSDYIPIDIYSQAVISSQIKRDKSD